MPAKDQFHDNVKAALVKDGWKITEYPLSIKLTKRTVHVDLGAEKPLVAEKDGRKIAVVIKTLLGESLIYAMQRALGQYLFYRYLLQKREPDRVVWLALPERALKLFAREPEIGETMRYYSVYIFIYDPKKETITRWIEPNITGP